VTDKKKMVELRIRMPLDEATALSEELKRFGEYAGFLSYEKVRPLHQAIESILAHANNPKRRSRVTT